MKNKLKLFFIAFVLLVKIQQSAAQPLVVQKLHVTFPNDTSKLYYQKDFRIFSEGWSELPQVNFWKQIVRLSPDSGILNVGATRQIAWTMSVKEWRNLADTQKSILRDSVRRIYGLPPTETIYFTIGKGDFYDFENVLPIIHRALTIFEEERTDPFFAQSILLIECPGTLKKSSAGAHGHFQLMKDVARNMGLIVNKHTDERKDFDKSARAAAKFISTVCAPYANQLLQNRNIAFHPNDIWYKLLVLHIYHAGYYNVAKAVDAMPNTPEGSKELITTLWQTKAGAFGNASQNYTQIALANTLILYDLIQIKCSDIECKPYMFDFNWKEN